MNDDVRFVFVSGNVVTVAPQERPYMWPRFIKNITNTNALPPHFRFNLTVDDINTFDVSQPIFIDQLTGDVTTIDSITNALKNTDRYTFRSVPFLNATSAGLVVFFSTILLILTYYFYNFILCLNIKDCSFAHIAP